MTSLDFQSLLKQEKALRQAELEQQHAQDKKIDSLEADNTARQAKVVAKPRHDDQTEPSPWFVELAERPVLEMDKARFQYVLVDVSSRFSRITRCSVRLLCGTETCLIFYLYLTPPSILDM